MKKTLSLLLAVLFAAGCFAPVSAPAATYAEQLKSKGFPSTYISALETLHKKYPKWTFEVLNTGEDWETAVSKERSTHSKQMIEKSDVPHSGYLCADCNTSASWVPASESAVKYYMDARNFLTEEHIFQFESNAYNSSQTQSGVETIIASTWMSRAEITYKNTSGGTSTYKNADGNTVKYSKAFMEAAKNSGMSAYYLASKAVREVGGSKPTAGGASGEKLPFLGTFNYYNIGAYSNASQGLQWASGYLKTAEKTGLYPDYDTKTKTVSGTAVKLDKGQYLSYIATNGNYYKVKVYNQSGTSFTKNGNIGYVLKSATTQYTTYGRPWTSPYKTIYYGAQFIADGYLQTQYTNYLQKFNVNPKSGSPHNHEYTTDVQAPMHESETTYKAYSKAGLLSAARTFYIPVYKNMPSKKCTVSEADASAPSTVAVNDNAVKGLSLQSRTTETLTFAWEAFSGATKYYVDIKNLTKGTSFGKTVTANSATLKGLTPANEYSVRVKAYTSKGWSDYSSSNVKHALPGKATGLKVTKVGGNSATLQWEKTDGADGYSIYKYYPSKKTYTKVKTVTGGNTLKTTVSSLKGYTNYYFAVAVVTVDSKTKTGAKSEIAKTKTMVSGVKLKSLKAPGNVKLKATWSEATGSADGYQIYYAKDKKFKKKVAEKIITKKSTTSYTGKNFTKGHTYYIRVRAFKTVKGKKVYGAWSNTKSIKAK